MELGLAGKNVIVGGGSKGIGLAIVEGFLREGANVCILARTEQRLLSVQQKLQQQFPHLEVLAYPCDCASAEALSSVKQQLTHHWTSVDIVVANAGDGRSSAEPIPEHKQWEATWRNNFDVSLELARCFLPLLQDSEGNLMFVSSIAGLEAFGAPVDYSTAKSAIQSLMKNLAGKVAPSVRVNAVAPGNVLFPGGSWQEKLDTAPEKVEKMIANSVPMQRFGSPDEIASSVLFLCSEQARFITGATLVVDGGQTFGVQ